jgi:hypothetical protein
MTTPFIAMLITVTAIVVTGLKEALSYCVKRLQAPEIKLTKEDIKKLHDIYDMTKKLLEMHNIKDDDGLPVWYTPRSIVESQSELLHIQGKISYGHERQTQALDKMVSALEAIDRKCERIETEQNRKLK